MDNKKTLTLTESELVDLRHALGAYMNHLIPSNNVPEVQIWLVRVGFLHARATDALLTK